MSPQRWLSTRWTGWLILWMSLSAGTMGVSEMAMVTGMEAQHWLLFIKYHQDTASGNDRTTSSRTLHCKAYFLTENSQPIGGSLITLDPFYLSKVVIHFKKNCHFGSGFAFSDLLASIRMTIQGLIDCLIYQYEIYTALKEPTVAHPATAQHSTKTPISWERRCNKGHMTITSTNLSMFLIMQKQTA